MSQPVTLPGESTSERQLAPPRKWLTNVFLAFAAVLLLLGLVAGGVYWRIHRYHQQALRDVHAELDRLRAAGEPITPEEMRQYHDGGPQSAEKTSGWLEALAALPEEDDESDETDVLFAALQATVPLSGDELARAEEMLRKRSEAFRLASVAAQVNGEARFPVAFEDGINAATDHNLSLIKLARWFDLRHRVAVSRGDADSAIENLHLIGAVAEALEPEPTILAQAIRNAMARTLFRKIPFLIDNLALTEAQLAELQSWLAKMDFQNGFRSGLMGERATGYHAFHYLMENPEQLIGDGRVGDGTLRRPADFRHYLATMRQFLAAADSPLRDARQQAVQVDAAVKQIKQSGLRWKKRELAGSNLLLSSLINSFDHWALAESDRNSAVAAIACRRHQLAHGRLPQSLAALCPEFLPAVPQDPFPKKPAPLRLVVTGNRFAIYSVGENLKDDRALLADPESHADSGIVVRLPLPSQRPKSKSMP